MGALTQDGSRSYRRIDFQLVPLAAGVKAIKGGLAMLITASTSASYFAPASSGKTGVVRGTFAETVDNTAGADGALSANLEYGDEVFCELVANDVGGTPVAVTDRGKICYALDDQTVTMVVGTCALGVVHGIEDDGLVAVEIAAFTEGEGAATGISAVAPVDPSSSAAAVGVATLASPQDHKHHIALAIPAAEGLMSGAYAGAYSPPAASTTAIKAIAAAARADGMVVMDQSTGLLWRFVAASTAADTSGNLVLVPGAGAGRWLLKEGQCPALTLPFTFATADGAVLFTVPVGARLIPRASWFDVAVTLAGGSASAIGASTSVASFNTSGDLLGGATGDVAATLVSTNTRMVGTVGARVSPTTRLLMIAADTIKFNAITSAFTSGSGNIRVLCDLLANPGA
jgi:hypothetical protein